jgi:uroporphyrinogen decarboxylase
MKLLEVLNGEAVWPPPVWLMRQAGRYLPEYRALRGQAGDFLSLCMHPELAAEVTLQPIRRFGFDAAILFSDILILPWALGQGLRFAEGEGPVLPPLATREALAGLRLDRALEGTAPVMETVRRVRAGLDADKALIGFAGGPFTVACYMLDGKGGGEFPRTRRLAYEDRAGTADCRTAAKQKSRAACDRVSAIGRVDACGICAGNQGERGRVGHGDGYRLGNSSLPAGHGVSGESGPAVAAGWG